MPITNFMEISHPEGGGSGKNKEEKENKGEKIPRGFEMREEPAFINIIFLKFFSCAARGAQELLSSASGGMGDGTGISRDPNPHKHAILRPAGAIPSPASPMAGTARPGLPNVPPVCTSIHQYPPVSCRLQHQVTPATEGRAGEGKCPE